MTSITGQLGRDSRGIGIVVRLPFGAAGELGGIGARVIVEARDGAVLEGEIVDAGTVRIRAQLERHEWGNGRVRVRAPLSGGGDNGLVRKSWT